jgi:hypothetical protein
MKLLNILVLLLIIVCVTNIGALGKTTKAKIKTSLTEHKGSCTIGRAACLASCAIQNCSTGSCNKKNICVCSRCDKGSKL